MYGNNLAPRSELSLTLCMKATKCTDRMMWKDEHSSSDTLGKVRLPSEGAAVWDGVELSGGSNCRESINFSWTPSEQRRWYVCGHWLQRRHEKGDSRLCWTLDSFYSDSKLIMNTTCSVLVIITAIMVVSEWLS